MTERIVRIRRARVDDAADIARVHVRSWQAAYRGILPDGFLDTLEPASRAVRWQETLQPADDGRFTFVAELLAEDDSPGEIIGFASGGPERDGLAAEDVAYDGEVYGLYLTPEHWRQGIGRRLLHVSVQRLIEQGINAIVIWVLKDNRPARAFYELFGGVVVREKSIAIGSANLIDVAYGWPDVRHLLNRSQ